MSRNNILLLVSMVALSAIGLSCSMTGTPPESWDLVWEDTFSGEGIPDPEKWVFAPRKSPDWAKYCTESEETVAVSEGKLHLRGIKNSSAEDTAAYQTGCISTKEKFSFTYGKIEVRAKLSKGKGSWPAIWMMPARPTYGGWPQSGEIDIMEHLNLDQKVYQTVHSTYIDVQDNRENPPHHTTVPVQPDEFNTYGLEWYPDRLEFYVNGQKRLTYPRVEGGGHEQWPFDQPFYLILDQALGGSWVGEIDDRDLPVEMTVDRVRVYK
ncbi:glycoside hydrolase family 16 protein [Halalkalibaculum sp. DA384]|uniref:glycoside hydrolase family 16 protein n=1 Tax=Halalkalibaculum sp. DA384 TaxID=3373606 RepID=UPI003754F5D9